MLSKRKEKPNPQDFTTFIQDNLLIMLHKLTSTDWKPRPEALLGLINKYFENASVECDRLDSDPVTRSDIARCIGCRFSDIETAPEYKIINGVLTDLYDGYKSGTIGIASVLEGVILLMNESWEYAQQATPLFEILHIACKYSEFSRDTEAQKGLEIAFKMAVSSLF